MNRFLTISSALLLMAMVSGAAADDRSVCASARGDDAINACSRLLANGQEKGRGLAALYRNRCAALNGKRESDRAIADCNEAIRLDSGDAAAYIDRGDAWRNKRDQDRAIADYGQAIKLEPKNAAAYAGRCISLGNKRDYDRALADCNDAVRLGEKNSLAYGARCFILMNKQQADRALNDCDESIRLDPNQAFAYNIRGFIAAGKRDYDSAIADYDKATRNEPRYQPAYYNRANAWRNKREYDRAIADLDEALRIDATNPNVYNIRGVTRLDKRDFDGAIADYNEATRLDPNFSAAFANRGYAWAIKRDQDRAIADYNEAIRLNPKYAWALNNRGWAFRNKGDTDRALADFNETLRIDPKYTFAYNNRGITYMDKRDYDRAIADFTDAIRADAGYTAAYTNRALAYERKGDRDRARTEFEAALAVPQKYNNGKWAHDTARERLAALAPSSGSNATSSADLPVQRPSPQQGSQGGRPGPSQTRGSRVALLIANTSYPDVDPPLTQPSNDARSLAEELKNSGFEVELLEDLSRQQLQDATDRFKKKVKPGTAALLYYSGFGIQAGRQNYMIPVNAQVWSERDVPRDGISVESVLNELSDNGMAVKLVIVDASRRNPFERRFRDAPAGLAPIVAPPNTLVMSAAGLGQVVGEASGKNSLFMTELLKEFRAGVVSLEEVFSRARIGVSRASDSEQVPWVSSTLMDSITFKPAEERRRTR